MKTNVVLKLHVLICILVVCSILFTAQVYGQNSCGNSAGNPQPAQFLCAGADADGSAINPVVGPNAVIKYYLHGGSISMPFDTNFTGIFSYTVNYPPNTQMFISAVVGAGPDPDFNDPCTDVQFTGSPVVFLQPISITHQFECKGDSVKIDYFIKGGYPGVVNSNYSIVGSEVNNVAFDDTTTFYVGPLNGTYFLNVEDNNGCAGSITQSYECLSNGELDLALIKRFVPGPGQSNMINPGDNVTFEIQVINQGTVPIIEVAINDYVPSGLILNDPNWQMVGSRAETILITSPSPFPPSSYFNFYINFTVAPTASTITAVNAAEIAAVKLTDNTIVYNDIDSTFDFDDGNDGTPIDNVVGDPADEDDHDIETITIIGSCDGEAGTMPTDTLFACDGDSLTSTQTGSVLAAGDAELYIIHTSPTNSFGTIFNSNTTGIFDDPGTDCNALYISYVFGPDDGNGKPDFFNDCTTILPGTPVIWSTPISIDASENCNMETEIFNVDYEVSGGFASCFGTNFTITGDVNGTSTLPDLTITDASPFANGATYSITATDNKGCTAKITDGPIVCENENPCGSTPGTMPDAAMYGCFGESLSATESGSMLGSGDIGLYILHDDQVNSGNIIASNTTGTFMDPQMYCSNLYISYAFGPDDGSGMLDYDDPCTFILEGTLVVWSNQITISTTVDCNEDSEEFTFGYTVNGGFPFCSMGNFTITGDATTGTANVGTTYNSTTIFNNGDTYSITATDSQNCSFTFDSNQIVCEDSNPCANLAGSMPTAQMTACADAQISLTETGSTLGDNDVGIYYLHDSPTSLGNIISSNTVGSFGNPQMDCTTLYISYVFGPDDNGDMEPDPDNPCRIVLQGTPVKWLPPVTISSTAECDEITNEYYITYEIGGGSSTCNVNSVFNVSGDVDNNNIVAGSYTSADAMTGGLAYALTVKDINGCEASFTSNIIDCDTEYCGNEPGTTEVQGIPNACAGSAVTVSQNNTNLQDDFVGNYYLHTNSGTTLGTVISFNDDGIFNDPEMPCEILYISYVFGLDDGTGNVTLDDDCTFVLAGLAVSWAFPLNIASLENCDGLTGTYTVDFTISGGFPQCDDSILYDVSGDVSFTDVTGGSYTSGAFNDGDSYSITLEDGNNCITNYMSAPITCQILCNNSAGTPNDEQIICEDNTADGTTSGASAGAGSTITYVLHNGANVNTLDTVYAANTSGQFLNDGTYPINRQLYISAVVGPVAVNDSIPDLQDACTVIGLPGSPVIFLTNLTITTEIMCNQSTGIATIDYVPNGGYPAFDNSQSYTITGAANTTALYGETKTFIDNSSSFSLTATDEIGCTITISELTDCNTTCVNQPGTQPNNDFVLCYDAEIDASSTGFLIGNDATLVYVLHNGEDNLGIIEAVNSDGIFENDGSYPTNEQLYISVMIGVLNLADIPELSDSCTVANFPGTPVTFLKELTASESYECNADGSAAVTFSISGGTGSYSVTGSYTGNVSEEEETVFNSPLSDETYTLEITDSNGCKTSIEEDKDCEPMCNNEAGSIQQDEVFICNGDMATFNTSNTMIESGYKLYYVLHNGATILGSVIDYNTTGNFTNNNQYDTNTQLYVSPVVTKEVDGEPDFEEDCRNITLPGQPVWFFEPITITHEPICSETTSGIYLVRFSIAGGAPAATGFNDKYSVSGVFGGTATLGETIESPSQTNSDYTLMVEDDEGCTTEIYETDVDCTNCPVFNQGDIQNIFSPNNDNLNNFWSVPNLTECYPDNQVIISNRWGNIVWETNGCADDCWDGRAQNSEKELPTGAYYYIIKLKGEESVEDDIIAGSITLLR